jgi:PEGA domain
MNGWRGLLSAALALAFGLAADGCMTVPHAQRMGYLKVVAEPATTTVYINDRFIGSAHLLQKQPKALPPGVKYLTFKAPGYFPHDLRVSLPTGETTVQIKLRPVPP